MRFEPRHSVHSVRDRKYKIKHLLSTMNHSGIFQLVDWTLSLLSQSTSALQLVVRVYNANTQTWEQFGIERISGEDTFDLVDENRCSGFAHVRGTDGGPYRDTNGAIYALLSFLWYQPGTFRATAPTKTVIRTG